MNNIWIVDTPLGQLGIYSDDFHLHMIQFIDTANNNITPSSNPSKIANSVSEQIHEYFNGTRRTFNLSLYLDLPPFYKKVLFEVSKIKYGQTASYMDIAIKSGDKKAVRAVGAANANNPIPIIIPCHRIIFSNGKIGGYGGGLEKKVFLLNQEGIDITL